MTTTERTDPPTRPSLLDPPAERLAPTSRLSLGLASQIALLARMLCREGYDDHIMGHISYALDDGSFYCTPWGYTWEEMLPAHILRIDAEGTVVEGDEEAPSALPLHVALHRSRADARVIIHNHPTYGTLWADRRQVPPIFDQTSALYGGEIVVYDEYPGSASDASAADRIVEGVSGADVALLANHGVLVIAHDIEQAYLRAMALEWRCRQAWWLGSTGVPMDPAAARAIGDILEERNFPGLFDAMVRREQRADPTLVLS
ncbi:MAG TPA: class II aldolase/adducin family protein [Acidimicrobiales bacterium]|nr:class II aldolase/adducin family protein [Acidimicrobiales bacterium]